MERRATERSLLQTAHVLCHAPFSTALPQEMLREGRASLNPNPHKLSILLHTLADYPNTEETAEFTPTHPPHAQFP